MEPYCSWHFVVRLRWSDLYRRNTRRIIACSRISRRTFASLSSISAFWWKWIILLWKKKVRRCSFKPWRRNLNFSSRPNGLLLLSILRKWLRIYGNWKVLLRAITRCRQSNRKYWKWFIWPFHSFRLFTFRRFASSNGI